MSSVDEQRPCLADLLGVSPQRIRLRPAPGNATEQDVIDIEAREDRLYELIDGVLVEKVMGYVESLIASELIRLMGNFVKRHRRGLVAGEAGMMQIAPGLVRIPDVSFVSWDRLPDREPPQSPIPNLAPDLAVEVLSKANTEKEMNRKIKDYFQAGVRLVWLIEPATRTARAYTSTHKSVLLSEHETLTGGKVLPGFNVPLHKLFSPIKRRPRK